MIRKSGYRFSEKIMLEQKDRRDEDSKKTHPALAQAQSQRLSSGQVAAWNCALDQSNMERQYALPIVDSTNAYLIS
jgi:hypothetical protein